MAEKSKIQWTDATWNVAIGCTKVDSDCKNCYMYRESLDGKRFEPKQIRRTKSVFNLPLKLKSPSKIFTSSYTDFFHPEIDSYRNEAWEIIRKCPQHTFQILTKRPERILEHLPEDWGDGYKNVWLGTSVGSNESRHRIEQLVQVPAHCHFVSFEPLYSDIDLNFDILDLLKIKWAIIGGESGNESGNYRYRPCKHEWMSSIIIQLAPTGTNFFVKQMGTHLAKEFKMSDRHGADFENFPKYLQYRDFPDLDDEKN